MPNSNYNRGARKERKLVNEARAEGKIALRSAGSHSPIDVVTIDYKDHIIELIQCKPDDWIDKLKALKLTEDFEILNGYYTVTFKVK